MMTSYMHGFLKHIAETQDRINQLIWLHDHAELSAPDIL